MRASPDAYPDYPRGERIADGLVHLAGIALALAGTVCLVVFAALHTDAVRTTGAAVYGGFLTLSILASAVYHFAPRENLRPALRRIDHAAIFLKIAGTYTPLVLLIGSVFSYAVLACVWVLAMAGAVAKLAFWWRPGPVALGLYLALGWGGVLLVWPMIGALPPAVAICAGIGGVLYTLGAVVFAWDGLRYALAIWHGLVLAASGCFYAAIAVGTFTA